MDSDNKKISQLTQVTSLNDSDLFVVSIDVPGAPKTRGIKKSDAIIAAGGFNQGFMTNGKIVPSVASNNLTVALKTLAGTDPSPTDKVTIRIGNVVRDITSALSVTKNAGTNWFNSGAAILATKEVDYFVYIGYNATDGVVLGFSRIPYANLYSDFSATTTNEKYAAISTITNAAAGNDYVNIGRFAATLSAGAGYTWTVPTFTGINLIQRPIYETRWLSWLPAWECNAVAITGITAPTTLYMVNMRKLSYQVYLSAYTIGATPGNIVDCTIPFNGENDVQVTGAMLAYDASAGTTFGGCRVQSGTPWKLFWLKYTAAAWVTGAGVVLNGCGFYQI